MIKKFVLFLIIILGTFSLPSFATELNSGNITQSPYDCPISATSCDLSNKGITAIASGTFINHINLQTLYLNNNSISSIDSGDFSGLENLQYLNLDSNQITSIESSDFSRLASLTYLSVYNNKIGTLESEAYINLTGLTYLALSNNEIISIENRSFAGLGSLMNLYLRSNQITSLESGDFAGLDNLRNLDLFSNRITSLESGDFAGLDNLTTLNFYANSISSIDSGDFIGLDSLTSLYLKSNGITSIESGDFVGLDNLISLDLSRNGIVSIDSGDFAGLGSLISLDLSTNRISSIDSGDFVDLTSLQTLNLYDNRITSIESGSFTPISGVITFDINNNELCTGTLAQSIIDFIDVKVGGIGRQDTQDTTNCPIFDIISPIGIITYSTTGITNQNITAIINLNETGIITNNGGSSSYIFTGNGSFTFQFQDMAGNTGEAISTVDWIDKTKPTAIVEYIPGSGAITSGNILAVLTGMNKIAFISNNGGLTGYIFTGNGTFTFRFADIVGNTGETIATVNWIDKEAPVVAGIINGTTYTTSVTLVNVTDNIGVESVVLNGNAITGRTNATINTIGTHTIIAIDTAGNKTEVTFEIKQAISSGGGGGGGGGSYIPPVEIIEIEPEVVISTGTVDLGPGQEHGSAEEELENAYEFAKEKKITTTKDIEEFEPDGVLIRKHLTKMISEFAIQVMGKTEQTGLIVEGCDNFEDMENETQEMKGYAKMACKLGLMGWNSDQKSIQKTFNPNVEINRAQFGTILSRLLRGNTYATEDSIKYYEKHLMALNTKGIMKIIDPEMKELRGWVILMLYRVREFEK